MKTWMKVLAGIGVLAVAYRYRGAIKGFLSPAAPASKPPVPSGSAPFVPPVNK